MKEGTKGKEKTCRVLTCSFKADYISLVYHKKSNKKRGKEKKTEQKKLMSN